MVGETQIATVEAAPPVGRTRPGLLLRRGVREVIGVIIPAILAALLIQVFVAQTTAWKATAWSQRSTNDSVW